ncbi:MAG TPA: VPLPA-CTERM sorting domain-containing protein [Gammaproteobacteria bacterium]
MNNNIGNCITGHVRWGESPSCRNTACATVSAQRSARHGGSILTAALLSLAAPVTAATIDYAQISHDIYYPVDANGDDLYFDGNATTYQLAGQSAFIQTRANDGTSGGQLDGATGFGDIQFTEVFPPPQITDYISFSYIGIADLLGTDSNGGPVVLDRSIVIAYQPGVAAGLRVEDLFPYTEATLVSQFTTQVDSPEFFDMAFNLVGGQANTSGLTAVLQTDCHNTYFCDPPTQIQYGEYLDLIAFVGGANGDEGVVIGSLGFGLTRQLNVGPSAVPVPAAAWLLGSGLLGLIGVARRKTRPDA